MIAVINVCTALLFFSYGVVCLRLHLSNTYHGSKAKESPFWQEEGNKLAPSEQPMQLRQGARILKKRSFIEE